MTGPRIVIGDDHPLVQAALRSALPGALPGAEIVEAPNTEAVVDCVGRDPAGVDLVLLDLNLPGTPGLAGLFLLLAHFPTVPVAILSAVQDPSTIRRALACGASGYIPKSLALPTMVAAIEAILRGEVWAPPEAEGAAEPEDRDLATRFASLSAQQLRILAMIVAGKLNKQIAAELGIAEQTVKIHVSTILRKLDVGTRTQAAVLAGRFGPIEARP
ncbi:MAG TPA: response regulator transcription factor [Beijerinckiaceae bacterium]|nr:response regulator transcription factor [Beijerinckiaceae bacterium]